MHDLPVFKLLFYKLPAHVNAELWLFATRWEWIFHIAQTPSLIHSSSREAVRYYAQAGTKTNHHGALSRCPAEFLQGFVCWDPSRYSTKMSKAVLDRLKPQECKRGSRQVKPPIPYIPEKDELQEAVESVASIKLTLPTNVELWVSVWSRGTHEKFLIHVQ